MDIDLEKLEVTQAYIDKYYMSDEAMYVRYKSKKNPDPQERSFIEWFENGKKPVPKPNFEAIRDIIVPMTREGLTLREFLDTMEGVSEGTLRRLFYAYEQVSEETCAKALPQIKNMQKKWNQNKHTKK
jgi:hypothetical protein